MAADEGNGRRPGHPVLVLDGSDVKHAERVGHVEEQDRSGKVFAYAGPVRRRSIMSMLGTDEGNSQDAPSTKAETDNFRVEFCGIAEETLRLELMRRRVQLWIVVDSPVERGKLTFPNGTAIRETVVPGVHNDHCPLGNEIAIVFLVRGVSDKPCRGNGAM
jgi:hypothetical protein